MVFDFPITELISEEAAYNWLVRVLHPEGLRCPAGHLLPGDQAPHVRENAPIVRYRCKKCHRVFTAFTGTQFARSRYTCVQRVLFLRGVLKGEPTAGLARELSVNRCHLGQKRVRLQEALAERFSPRRIV
jgi:transposase-like protein